VDNSSNPEEIISLKNSEIFYANLENKTVLTRKIVYGLGHPPKWDFSLVDLVNDKELKISFENQESCSGGILDRIYRHSTFQLIKKFNGGKLLLFSYQDPVEKYVLYDSKNNSMKCLLDKKFGNSNSMQIDIYDSFNRR
jgi:hypothetical protein